MLELRSICKRLGSFALTDFELRLETGEYFVLLGPSGVGKTVLLELVAGLIRPDAGQIIWRGKDITFSPPQARVFPLVYQDYTLFPHMTAAENIAYGLKAMGTKSGSVAERVHSLAEMLSIGEQLNQYPDTLSGGQQQRVALARALAIQPQMLLLDEPLSALDTNIRLRMRKELRRIQRATGITFLHVTHDVEEAMSLGDRIGVMLNSRIHQIAKPEELFRTPSDRDVAEFLGLYNVLPVTKAKDGICRTCGVEIHVSSADESTAFIWIKPEEILLSKEPFDSSARNQFRCTVVDWEHRGILLAINISIGDLRLRVLITYTSFKDLAIEVGTELYATFKSTAVHCF